MRSCDLPGELFGKTMVLEKLRKEFLLIRGSWQSEGKEAWIKE